jgi:hypothetical protein
MRTLMEITESAKDGQKPTHDECYWAMLALDMLLASANLDLRAALEHLVIEGRQAPSELVGNMLLEENFQRSKRVYAADPKVWLGPSWDPSNPQRQKERQTHKRILGRFMKKFEEKPPGS